METTKLLPVQIAQREMGLFGVMEIANGLTDNVNQKVCNNSKAFSIPLIDFLTVSCQIILQLICFVSLNCTINPFSF